MRVSRSMRGRLAWLTSFLKLNWSLSDYPLDYVEQGESAPDIPVRLRRDRWCADVIGWPGMWGGGESREAALADLTQKFAARKASGDKMYRPGTGPEITFAASQKVDAYPELRDHFIQNVLGLEWAFISNESTLWDFHVEETNDSYLLKIGEVYGVDASHIEGGNLAAILELIMQEIGHFPEHTAVREVRLSRAARDRHVAMLPEHPWNPYY